MKQPTINNKMTEQESLSDRIINLKGHYNIDRNAYILTLEDVKEFIKKLKCQVYPGMSPEEFLEEIDIQFGEKLTK